MYSKEYFQKVKIDVFGEDVPDGLINIMKNIDKILFKEQVNDWRNKPKPNFLKRDMKDQGELFKNEINSMLNKLSESNYEGLSKKIGELMIKCEFWEYFIEQLFSKSIIQPFFCPVYVRMLSELENKEQINILLEDKINNYLDILNKKQDKTNNSFNYDEFCKSNKMKIIKGGYSQFIGELYRNNLCKYKYIVDNIKCFLDNIENEDSDTLEDNIICLDKLIRTISDNMNLHDKKEIKNKISFQIQNKNPFPIRLKFKLMNLIETI